MNTPSLVFNVTKATAERDYDWTECPCSAEGSMGDSWCTVMNWELQCPEKKEDGRWGLPKDCPLHKGPIVISLEE